MNETKQIKNQRLFLLDGMALVYRAYFTFITRPLINSKGENTSAIYGFVNTLIKILEEEKPEHIAVVFDTAEPTFRHKIYKPYKATREKMPEDLAAQMKKLKEVVDAFNVHILELPGYEADDIMGTLSKKAEVEKIETYLVTGDKDFMQIISPLTKMYKPGKSGDEWEIIDENLVKQKIGVAPNQVVDLLALLGDKSDNIPGVPGIGEKSAVPLIKNFKTLENLFNNLDKVPQPHIKEKLQQHRENAFLSKHLVTIDTNVPISTNLNQLRTKTPNRLKLVTLFTELEFKSLIKKYSSIEKNLGEISFDPTKRESPPLELELQDIKTDRHTYHIVQTKEELQELIKILSSEEIISFDTETTSKNPLTADLIGISFSIKPHEAWYVPIANSSEDRVKSEEQKAKSNDYDEDSLFSTLNSATHSSRSEIYKPKPTSNNQGFNIEFMKKYLSPIFSEHSIRKIGQNIKYDILVLKSYGIEVQGIIFDTMVANYILRPDGQHNLDALAREHLNYKMIPYDELISYNIQSGKSQVEKTQRDIREIPLLKIAEYSAQDADITLRLYEILKDKLSKQNLLTLCNDIEFPLIQVLANMEFNGVSLDVNYLHSLSEELDQVLNSLTLEIYDLAGEKFNINSTQQLSKILFDKLNLSTVRKTKTGFSTDVGVLETLKHEHPIIEKLLDYRQLQKLKSTYVDTLPNLVNPKTNRLHTSFNQTITATGRLSSSNPNLQNIPIRTEIGKNIRKAFIPQNSDWVILDADYSQIELRVMAHVSGDEELINAFKNGEDIHSTTASKIFGVDIKDISKEMRRKAKEVNFGIMYGIGSYGLATRLDISQTEAKEIIETYFKRFPKVKEYIHNTLEKARTDGYVSTLLGRRRYLPDIKSKNQTVRGNAERQAINMPIQGTAADMIKIAMVKIHKFIQDSGLKIHMLLQVHDELVFEVANSELTKAKFIIIEEMKNALPLSVPIEVEIGVGKNWLEAH